MARILIYSHDTYGLGNIRRMTTIAEALVQGDPDVSVLIVTGSPMLHAFRLSERIDYVKLPCLNRTDVGRYDVKHLSISQDSARRMRASIIAAAAVDFDPDIVLVDKKPLGVMRELEPALDILSRRPTPARITLILRDILDAPEKTRDVWRRNRYHEQIERYYDDILVVGARDIFDLAEEYAFPPETAAKMHYAGFLRRSPGKTSPADIRARLGLGEESIVLVQAGGGGDGAAMIDAYLAALERYGVRTPFFSWIISGPEMSAADRRRISHAVAKIPMTMHQDFVDDMNACINAADYVVSMGGYNSVCEIFSLEKPALIVPRVKPVEEQWVRAERLARCGMVECLHPDAASADAFYNAVNRMIACGRDQIEARGALSLDGLDYININISQSASRYRPPLAMTADQALR